MHAGLSVSNDAVSPAPMGERINGAWQEAPGLMFADRQRLGPGDWVAEHAEATGSYQFYVQAQAHRQCGEFNGLPQHGWCPAGALQLLRPDELVFPAGAGPARFLHITISPGFLAQQLAEHFPGFEGGEFKRGYRSDLALHRLARAHEAGIDHGLSGQQLYFDQLRAAILSRLLLALSTLAGHASTIEKEGLAPFRARRVVDFIEENLAQDLRLDTLADIAGTSKFHFSRAFRNTMGTTPHAFVMQRRLLRALGLLRSKQPVGEVARLCGFADHAHLTRLFKRSFGMPPSNVAAGDGLTARSHQSAWPAFSIRRY